MGRRRTLLSTLLAATALAGGGCGSTPEPEGDQRAAVTSDELIADFGAQPGKPTLVRAGGDDPKFEQLGIGLDAPPDLRRRYGTFSIYVVNPEEERAKAALLTDKTTGKPLEPDGRGIYWEYDDQSRTWIANTVYGENVVLVWFSEKRERATDARWERLHAFLKTSAVG